MTTDNKRPTREEVDRCLLLADEENENSISHGKNFNSDGWAKKILSGEVRALRDELEAEKSKNNKYWNGLQIRIDDARQEISRQLILIEKLREALDKIAKDPDHKDGDWDFCRDVANKALALE